MNNLQPIDVVQRLVRCYPHWFGKLDFGVVGNVGEFGTLFIQASDWEISWKIYIQNKDHILKCTRAAINNTRLLIRLHWED